MKRSAGHIICCCLAWGLTGCEEKKPAAAAAHASKPAQPAKEPDLGTVASLLNKQSPPPGGAAPASAAPGLPAGHPSVGGSSPGKTSGELPAGHPPMGAGSSTPRASAGNL